MDRTLWRAALCRCSLRLTSRQSAARRRLGEVGMTEDDLRGLIARVKDGRLSRRGFVKRMAAVGLTAPMATQILAIAGAAPAAAQSVPEYKPTRRGGGTRRPAPSSLPAENRRSRRSGLLGSCWRNTRQHKSARRSIK